MKMNLDAIEIRILGCLMEKELTTPESYPLSLNALTNACNQKSNRDPMMSLREEDVVRGLDSLGFKGLARLTATGGRVARYRHSVADKLGLKPTARAVLSELLLRGPQTIGELRNRAERMASLPDLAAVEDVLTELQRFAPPLVICLPRQPGRKDQRFAHLFAGMPDLSACEASPPPEKARQRVAEENNRLAKLDTEVGALRTEIGELQLLIKELKSQFE